MVRWLVFITTWSGMDIQTAGRLPRLPPDLAWISWAKALRLAGTRTASFPGPPQLWPRDRFAASLAVKNKPDLVAGNSSSSSNIAEPSPLSIIDWIGSVLDHNH